MFKKFVGVFVVQLFFINAYGALAEMEEPTTTAIRAYLTTRRTEIVEIKKISPTKANAIIAGLYGVSRESVRKFLLGESDCPKLVDAFQDTHFPAPALPKIKVIVRPKAALMPALEEARSLPVYGSTIFQIGATEEYKIIHQLNAYDREFFAPTFADEDLVTELKRVKAVPVGSSKEARTINVGGIPARHRIAAEAKVIQEVISTDMLRGVRLPDTLGNNKHFKYVWDARTHVCGQFKPTISQPGNIYVIGLGKYSQTIFQEIDAFDEHPSEIAGVMMRSAVSGDAIGNSTLKEDGLDPLSKTELACLNRLAYLITDVEVARRIPRGLIQYKRASIPGVVFPYGTINAMALMLIENDLLEFNQLLLPEEAYSFFTGQQLETPGQVKRIVLPKMLSIVKEFSDFLGEEGEAVFMGLTRSHYKRDPETDLYVPKLSGLAKILQHTYGV